MGKTNGAAMSSCISPVNVQLHLPCVFSGFQGCYVMEHAPGMVCDVVVNGMRMLHDILVALGLAGLQWDEHDKQDCGHMSLLNNMLVVIRQASESPITRFGHKEATK